MKKTLFSILIPFIILSSLSAEPKINSVSPQKIYFDYNFYEDEFKDIFDSALEIIQENAADNNITLIDFKSLDLKNENIFLGSSDQPKSQKLIDEKIKTLETYDMFSKFYDDVTIEGRNRQELEEYYDNLIANQIEKEKNQLSPKDCFPRLKLQISSDYNWDYEETFTLESSLYMTNNQPYYNSSVTFNKGLNDEFSKISLIIDYVSAYFSLFKSEKKVLPPSFIDSRQYSIKSYTGDTNGYPVSIAARDDYSFVLRTGNNISDYSPVWDEIKNYDSSLKKPGINNTWEIYCADGENVVFANFNSPSVYELDSKGILNTCGKYNLPLGWHLSFLSSGKPFYSILENGYPKFYVPDSKNNFSAFPKQPKTEYDFSPVCIEGANSFIPGPDETLYTQKNNSIFVYDANTSEITKIIHLDANSGVTYPYLISVNEDGSFIIKDGTVLYRFACSGNLLWSYKLPSDLQYSTIFTSRNGMYYLYDSFTKIVWRLAESNCSLPPVLAELRLINNLQNANLSQKADIYLSVADTYYEAESYEAAIEYYEKYLAISPKNYKATENKHNAELIISKKAATKAFQSALDLFNKYGIENARPDYENAIKALEILKKEIPWDNDITYMYNTLYEFFAPNTQIASIPSITVEEVELTSLFPALINVYSAVPAGHIKITNNSDNEIKNLFVSSFAKQYMDFAADGDIIDSVLPGETVFVNLYTPLNQNALSLNEAVNIQLLMEIKWEENSLQNTLSITRPVTIYKRSAISWEDTAMLSCFVLPNDDSVQNFAFTALGTKIDDIINTKITKAIQLTNALGAIPLTYVSDPDMPVSEIIDNNYAVDTVRSPDETLSLKGGDCDDLTSLWCSLLESTGIHTAFITIPGHIFAAFNTEIKANDFWNNFNSDYQTINYNNQIWIPIEITTLSKGFNEAWKLASTELSNNSDVQEFIPLEDAWKFYSPIITESSQLKVKFDNSKYRLMNNQSAKRTIGLITDSLENYDYSNLEASDLNQIAKLYASINRTNDAIMVLNYSIDKFSDYKNAYTNLYALYNKEGMRREALSIKEKSDKLFLADAFTSSDSDTKRAEDASEDSWEN